MQDDETPKVTPLSGTAYRGGPPRVTDSSGNVFRDLNLPCADEKLEIVRLRALLAEALEACGEAYQVIGNLAGCAGIWGHPKVIQAMDNISAAAAGKPRPHANLLPFCIEDAGNT